MEPLSDAELDAIEAYTNAASGGPWFWNSYSAVFSARCRVSGKIAPSCFPEEGSDDYHDEDECTPVVAWVPRTSGDTATKQGALDARFIEKARTDMPRLIAALREIIQAYRVAQDDMRRFSERI